MINGLKSMDHVGITVPNIDGAISFLKSILKLKQ